MFYSLMLVHVRGIGSLFVYWLLFPVSSVWLVQIGAIRKGGVFPNRLLYLWSGYLFVLFSCWIVSTVSTVNILITRVPLFVIEPVIAEIFIYFVGNLISVYMAGFLAWLTLYLFSSIKWQVVK